MFKYIRQLFKDASIKELVTTLPGNYNNIRRPLFNSNGLSYMVTGNRKLFKLGKNNIMSYFYIEPLDITDYKACSSSGSVLLIPMTTDSSIPTNYKIQWFDPKDENFTPLLNSHLTSPSCIAHTKGDTIGSSIVSYVSTSTKGEVELVTMFINALGHVVRHARTLESSVRRLNYVRVQNPQGLHIHLVITFESDLTVAYEVKPETNTVFESNSISHVTIPELYCNISNNMFDMIVTYEPLTESIDIELPIVNGPRLTSTVVQSLVARKPIQSIRHFGMINDYFYFGCLTVKGDQIHVYEVDPVLLTVRKAKVLYTHVKDISALSIHGVSLYVNWN